MYPELTAWTPLSTNELLDLFGGLDAQWWLAGGEGIDRHLRRKTREHGDIDASTIRADWERLVAALPEHLLPVAAHSGRLFELDTFRDDPEFRNIWVLNTANNRWALQINIEHGDGAEWRYRRNPRITLPWSAAVTEIDGMPTGTLHQLLLWKGTGREPKDLADVQIAAPTLTSAELQWLIDAVTACHPESPWLPLVKRM